MESPAAAVGDEEPEVDSMLGGGIDVHRLTHGPRPALGLLIVIETKCILGVWTGRSNTASGCRCSAGQSRAFLKPSSTGSLEQIDHSSPHAEPGAARPFKRLLSGFDPQHVLAGGSLDFGHIALLLRFKADLSKQNLARRQCIARRGIARDGDNLGERSGSNSLRIRAVCERQQHQR